MGAELAWLASLGFIEFAPSANGHAVVKVTRDGLVAMLRRLAGKQAFFMNQKSMAFASWPSWRLDR
jgi:hypothetical protein